MSGNEAVGKKDIVRQVIHSPRRFVAILLIVMLGVAFFAGVRATCPDMRLTLDRYFDEYRASDVHLLSTYGFTDGDVAAVKEAGEGRYSPPTPWMVLCVRGTAGYWCILCPMT